MNVPNLLTIGRIFAVPVLILLIGADRTLAAFWLFVVVGATDAADGMIARRFNLKTELGAFLDPLADKALLISLYVTLAVFAEIPRWLAVVVVFRDVVIMGGVLLAWLIERPLPMEPLAIGKANTLAQIVFVGTVLGADGYALDWGLIEQAAAYGVGGLTLLSAGAYLVAFIRHMALSETARPDA